MFRSPRFMGRRLTKGICRLQFSASCGEIAGPPEFADKIYAKKLQASVLAEACLRARSDRVLSPETTSQIS
jgi:hypothetical protein